VNLLKHAGPLCISSFLIFFLGANSAGQRGGSTMQMGNHAIEIHLTNQRGAALNLTVKVEILTDMGLKMAEAFSNREEGVADFEGFNDGYFQLRVSGPGIETVVQTFQITATEATHREYIRVDVKNTAPPAESSSPGSDPTVSAEDLSIPAKAREEFARGMEAHANGDDREAQAALERALELYPNYVKALNNLGVLYLRAGLKEKANLEFSKAVQIDPKFAPGHVNLAKVAISNGSYAQAEPELKKAIASDPSALNAMQLLCSTHYALQEYNDALLESRHLHQLTQDAQYADVHLLAADILVKLKKPQESIAEYELFMKESPTDPRVPKVKSLVERLATKPLVR
jgi:tetratricopeptide (TPR) repeat protein